MKKTFLYGIGIVLMVLCGCKQEETWYSYDSSGKTVLKIRIENNADTRTEIGEGNQVLWQLNDTIGVFGTGETKVRPSYCLRWRMTGLQSLPATCQKISRLSWPIILIAKTRRCREIN